VAIPGHPCEAVSYRELCDFEQAGEQTIIRSLGGKVVRLSVPDLLAGVDLDGARQRHPQRRVRLFVSYAHRDETHKATLGGHLLPLVQEGLIHWWDDRHLRPGDDWAGDIDRNLEQADVILLLVSCHFLASRYCTTIEVPRALERQRAGQSLVVPIILDGSDTSGQPFMSRQVLPTDNRPILEPRHWPDPNDGWRQVVGALREVVQERSRLC
jgi:internalin A